MFANASIHAEDDLLDISFDLTDKEGILAAKMKIVLSSISTSRAGDNIEEFMNEVDNELYDLKSTLPSNLNNLSILEQVLKSIMAIMDHFSQVTSFKFESHNIKLAHRGHGV